MGCIFPSLFNLFTNKWLNEWMIDQRCSRTFDRINTNSYEIIIMDTRLMIWNAFKYMKMQSMQILIHSTCEYKWYENKRSNVGINFHNVVLILCL